MFKHIKIRLINDSYNQKGKVDSSTRFDVSRCVYDERGLIRGAVVKHNGREVYISSSDYCVEEQQIK